jgi:hypothetical protein
VEFDLHRRCAPSPVGTGFRLVPRAPARMAGAAAEHL